MKICIKRKKIIVPAGDRTGLNCMEVSYPYPQTRKSSKISFQNLFVSISLKFIQKCGDFDEFFPIFLTLKRAKLRALTSPQHETLVNQSNFQYTLKDIHPVSAPSCTSEKFTLLYIFLSIFAIMLSFSGGNTKKDIVFQNFMKEYNFFQFDQKFVNMLHKVKKGFHFAG